jgi:hypothetical protein
LGGGWGGGRGPPRVSVIALRPREAGEAEPAEEEEGVCMRVCACSVSSVEGFHPQPAPTCRSVA